MTDRQNIKRLEEELRAANRALFFATAPKLRVTPISKPRHHWNKLVKYIKGLFYKVPPIPQHIVKARSHTFVRLGARSYAVSYPRHLSEENLPLRDKGYHTN